MAPKLTKEEETAKAKAEADAKAKKAVKDARKAALKAAKGTLTNFSQTKEYDKLPEDVRSAITRLMKTTKGGGGKGSLVAQLKALFPKVGAALSELDLFKATKMGRREFQKKVTTVLKKAEPENRMWVKLNEEAETWTLMQIGGQKAPKGWNTD